MEQRIRSLWQFGPVRVAMKDREQGNNDGTEPKLTVSPPAQATGP
jgi:hypothetical protein